MIRRNFGALWGLGLAVAAACSGGGSANNFGVGPSDDAPTHTGSPSDPNAPRGSTNDPPFGDVAPPGSDLVPGGNEPPPDCRQLCDSATASGCDDEACFDDCQETPFPCLAARARYIVCRALVACDQDLLDACADEVDSLDFCLDDNDPDPPDPPGGGGQGGF